MRIHRCLLIDWKFIYPAFSLSEILVIVFITNCIYLKTLENGIACKCVLCRMKLKIQVNNFQTEMRQIDCQFKKNLLSPV